jgi:hypothetical protein
LVHELLGCVLVEVGGAGGCHRRPPRKRHALKRLGSRRR